MIHLDLGFTMLGVNLKDAVVGNDGFTGLIAFFVKDSQVIPDLTAVWLDVLRLKDRVESLLILVLEVEHDGVGDKIS